MNTLRGDRSGMRRLGALLLFGALMSPAFLLQASWRDYLFALAALLFARPIALMIALGGVKIGWREKIVAAWFGPKGFASVVYAIIVLRSRLPNAERIFHLIALVIVMSIVAHSSSDVPIARWFPAKDHKSATKRRQASQEV